MLKKKICMLGAYGVGKTSLIRNFVYSIFEDRYHSTVGVKIDKKVVEIGDQAIEFLLWDIAGEDERFTVPVSYLRGASGYLLVIDGTRKDTFEKALDLQRRTEEADREKLKALRAEFAERAAHTAAAAARSRCSGG